MTITKLLTDNTILQEMGRRLTERRLDLQLTPAEVATEAGLSKRTVERIEAAAAARFSNIIRLLRVLDLLEGLDNLIPETGPSPMDLLKRKGKVRQRVSSRRRENRSDEEWTWGDET